MRGRLKNILIVRCNICKFKGKRGRYMRNSVQKGTSSVSVLSNSIFYINDVFKGKYPFLSRLLCGGLFHEYNFDKTTIEYVKSGMQKLVFSSQALTRYQLLALLYYMRIHHMDITKIVHSGEKEYVKIEANNLSDKSASIEIRYPEDGEWFIEQIIKEYNENSFDIYHRAFLIYVKDISIKELINIVNKNDDVLAVIKIPLDDKSIYLIESEALALIVSDKDLMIISLFNENNIALHIKHLLDSLNIHKNDVVRLLMM